MTNPFRKTTDEADQVRQRRQGVEAYKKTAPVKVILLVAVIVVAVVAIMAVSDHNTRLQNINQLEAAAEAMQKKPAVWQGSDALKDAAKDASMDTASSEDPLADYESPIDFGTLKNENEEVIGWLSIPGTDIEYPILQSKDDNTFYLNHNIEGDEDRNGALYTEVTYNRDDFSDPVTAIYGHNMASGAMFGDLQEIFSQGFDGHDKAIVYLPDSQKEYKLIAALPIGAGHLLYGRNMRNSDTYLAFADDLINGDHQQVLADDVSIEEGQRILVLSTCVGNRPDQRYIVAGIEQDYEPDAKEDIKEDDKDDLRVRKAEATEDSKGAETEGESQTMPQTKKKADNKKVVVYRETSISNPQDKTESAQASEYASQQQVREVIGSGEYASPKTGRYWQKSLK